MKDLIQVMSSVDATQAIYQFWRGWGRGKTPAERYQQILDYVAEQPMFEEVVWASVAMEDWHSGLRSFILHQGDHQAVLDCIAPMIDGLRQPQVPLPFQGTLKAPRLVILASNPQNDRGLLTLPAREAFDHQVMNLKNISGTWPIPGTFLPDQLSSKGTFVHDNYIQDPDALISADDLGNDHQFGIREVVRISWFPYRSAKFASSPFRQFNTSYPEHWLASQKLMLTWVAAYLRRVSQWPTEKQPMFITRQDTNWRRAIHTAIERSDYQAKTDMLDVFDRRLFYYAGSSVHLTRNNVIPAQTVAELHRFREARVRQGKADFINALNEIFAQP